MRVCRHAHEQVDNTLGEEDYYYADYLEMRFQQCSMLQTPQKQCDKDPEGTKAGSLCSTGIWSICQNVLRRKILRKNSSGNWKKLLDQMNLEALPRTREEFENRAILFHVLMDLREFLEVKQHFLEAHPRHPDTM